MKPTKKIEQLKRDITELFGPDDPATRAVELRERYALIGQEFERLRGVGYSYQQSVERCQQVFYVCETTVKNAISFYNSLVNKM